MKGQPQKKRKRTENWSLTDKTLLKRLIAEKVAIIENKNVDTNTNKCKKDCWDSIMVSFNAASNVSREVSQLQFQWRGMKLKAKRIESDYRRRIQAAGGGPAPKPLDQDCSDIMELISNEFKKDSNKFDSDGPLQQNSQQNTVSQIKNEIEDEEYADHLGLENDMNESHISVGPYIVSTPAVKHITNSSPVVKKNNVNNNDETKMKLEIFELTKSHMVEEHDQRMQILRLERECRLKEIKKLDLEIDILRRS